MLKDIFHIQDENRAKIVNKKTGKVYATKLQFLLGNNNYNDLELVFDNGFWDTVDWTKEPKEDLLDLLDERCRQLREKYNYLVLYYSGGADTETVIQSFIRSNTYLNEVVINRICFNNNDPGLLDIELAIQKLKLYSKQMPSTRITINNITDKMLLDFANKQQWIDTPFNGTIGMFRRTTIDDFSEYDAGKIFARGTTGHIFGDLKPTMSKRDGLWYNQLTHWGTATTSIGEWFFTSKDFPQLHVKQCHLVKNYFDKHNIETLNVIGGLSDQNSIKLYNGKTIRQHLEAACRLAFNQTYQPIKMMGLGIDILPQTLNNEDSLIYKHMNKYAPEVFKKYTYGVVIPILNEIKSKQYMSSKLDLIKIQGKQYCISTLKVDKQDNL